MYRCVVWITAVVCIVLSLLLAGGVLAAQGTRSLKMAELPVEQAMTPPPPQQTGDVYPAIEALATYFGVSTEEMKALHDSGVGLGVIAEAYVLSDLLDVLPQDIIDLKTGGDVGWGQILKDAGLDQDKVKVRLGDIVAQRKGREAAKVELMATPTGGDPAPTQEREQERTREQDREQKQVQDGSGGGSGNGGSGGGGGGKGK